MFKAIINNKFIGAGMIGFIYGAATLIGEYVAVKIIKNHNEKRSRKEKVDNKTIIDAMAEEIKK